MIPYHPAEPSRRRTLFSLASLASSASLASLGAWAPWSAWAAGAVPAKFTVVHQMRYLVPDAQGKPKMTLLDLSAAGVPYSPIIGIFNKIPLPAADQFPPLTAAQIESLLAGVEPGPFPTVLDLENWDLHPTSDPQRYRDHLTRLIAVIEGFRQARPNMRFGYYSVAPPRVYWELLDPHRAAERQAWENDLTVIARDFAPHLDAVFPSLYTFYPDRNGWLTYAKGNLAAARRLGRPVIAYLWPKFHEGGAPEVRGQYLSADYWRLQLQTVRELADGVVIWNFESRLLWDDNAPWWLATREFLARSY